MFKTSHLLFPAAAMLLHIPHSGNLHEHRLLPRLQGAVVNHLARVFHLRQKICMFLRKVMMLSDVSLEFINECVPSFFVCHILKICYFIKKNVGKEHRLSRIPSRQFKTECLGYGYKIASLIFSTIYLTSSSVTHGPAGRQKPTLNIDSLTPLV